MRCYIWVTKCLPPPFSRVQGGYFVSIVLALLGFTCACRFLLNAPHAPYAWLHFAACGLVGIVTAYAYVWIAQVGAGRRRHGGDLLRAGCPAMPKGWL